MAHNPTSSDLTGPCEKFFGAITGTTALRAMRRVSLRPQTPKPNIPAAGTLPKYDPSAKVLISLQPDKSTSSPFPIPISAAAAKAHPGHGIGEAAELVPIMFVPADEKKKFKVEMAGKEKNFSVAIIAPEMAPELQFSSQKEDDIAKLMVGMVGQAARAKPNTEPAPAHLSAVEKLKPKAGMAQPEVVQKTKLEMQDKPKSPVELQLKPVVKQGQKEDGNKAGHHNIDHRCSAYIDRTKFKMRATSDVGKSNQGADSSNSKMKAKTASNVGVGKSASFKKGRASMEV